MELRKEDMLSILVPAVALFLAGSNLFEEVKGETKPLFKY